LQDGLNLRKRTTQALVIEASRYEALEEMFFWPIVRECHPGGDALADEAMAQEQRASRVLAELDGLEAGDARLETLLGAFTEAAREHIEFEESQVWPGLHAVLPAEAAEELGRSPTARDRPHPAASAQAPRAGRAQGDRAGRFRRRPGTRRGNRTRRRLTLGGTCDDTRKRPGRSTDRPWPSACDAHRGG
jgi:Hemerythrin HHE cation binding domain